MRTVEELTALACQCRSLPSNVTPRTTRPRTGTSVTTRPVSPNTVLANALLRAEDVLTPRILTTPPARIVLVVGTQINDAPHIATFLVQSLAFAMAARLYDRFGIRTEVLFSALDNAPYQQATDPVSGHHYQRAYAQAVDAQALTDLVDALYLPLFTTLSRRLGIPYRIETYTQQQASEHLRRTWLRLLPRLDAARWWLAPSTGTPHLRIPCPQPGCGWAEKHAERTRVHLTDRDMATIAAVCLHHGPYQATITPTSGAYLDLATLYRNLVKELALTNPKEGGTLHVMVKGGAGSSAPSSSTRPSKPSASPAPSSPPACSAPRSSPTPVPNSLNPSSAKDAPPCRPTRRPGCSTPGNGPAPSPNTPTNCWP